MLKELLRFEEYKALNPCELTPQQLLTLEKELINPRPNKSSDEYVDFKLWLNVL